MKLNIIRSTKNDPWIDLLPVLGLSSGEIYSTATGKISEILDIRIGWLLWEVIFSFTIAEKKEDSIGIDA